MDMPKYLDIRLNLTSERTQQHLLTGLDQWLRLGLLSDAQARQLGITLSERLPIIRPTAPPAPVRPVKPTVPHPVTRVTRAFIAEMSVIWLLFLGVFLVVVSSAVLAASQWAAFPPVGQYGVLFAYTLGFWGVSQWAGHQERLQTTARMLAIATLLLFPINAWVIDALGLLRQPMDLILASLTLLGLSYITFKLLTDTTLRVPFLLLGWGHLGWAGNSGWPLLATYIGTVGTTAYLAYRHRTDGPTSAAPTQKTARIVVLLSLVVLLSRSLLIAQTPISQLGLAFGLCGALLVWLTGGRLLTVAGGLLMVIGWATTVEQTPPWQALGVSGLAFALLWNRLKQHRRRSDLLGLIGVGIQAYWLLWFVFPQGVRSSLLQGLSMLSPEPVLATDWAGIAFLPAVAGVLLLVERLRTWQQPALVDLSEGIALLLGLGLTLLSVGNPLTLAVNLTGSAGLLFWQLRSHPRLLNVAHGVGVVAIAAWIYTLTPDLSIIRWSYVGLTTLTVEWALSLGLRSQRWRRSTWLVGIAIAAATYVALLYGHFVESPTAPFWPWLWVPVVLTIVANHPRALRPQQAVALTMVALVLHTPFMLQPVWTGDIGSVPTSFALGTLCIALSSQQYPRDLTALFTVGSGLAALISGWIWLTDNFSSQILLVWAIEIVGLWTVQRWLGTREEAMARLYNRALQGWSIVLLVTLYGYLSLTALAVYATTSSGTLIRDGLLAAGIPLLGLGWALKQRSTNGRWYGTAIGVALVTAFVILNVVPPETSTYPQLAVATLALGLLTQLAGDGWTRRQQVPYRSSWHAIPIAYAVGGWCIHHSFGLAPLTILDWDLTADAGLYTWAAALVLIGVGRRQARWQSISYLGLLGISLGAYELLVYQLLQASGGQPGDGLTLLAGLAALIAGCNITFARWLLPYLRISPQGLRTVAHLHWLLGTVLTIGAILARLSYPTGLLLWTAISLMLAGYALTMGNRYWTPTLFGLTYENWTWFGLVEALLVIAYARFELFPNLAFLLNWGGVIACVLGFGLYRLPWSRWGWPAHPWQSVGLGLPLLTLSITLNQVKTQNLLLVGAFYAWVAQRLDRIRLSYLSVLLFNWAVLRFLSEQGWLTALWLGTVAGLSILYIVEVEPRLQPTSLRDQRHALRLLGSGLIAATALYQTEVSQPMLAFAGLALLIGLGLIATGITLQVRAYLYVGTGLFMAQTLRILWQLVSTDALLLWAIGIVLGLLFIWVAATFESRRTQVSDLLSQWSAQLETWA